MLMQLMSSDNIANMRDQHWAIVLRLIYKLLRYHQTILLKTILQYYTDTDCYVTVVLIMIIE